MYVRTAADLGKRLRNQRKARGWSQTELGRAIGVSRFWVSQMERGKESVELGLVLDAARALGMLVDVSDAARAPVSSGSPAADIASIVARPSPGRTPLVFRDPPAPRRGRKP